MYKQARIYLAPDVISWDVGVIDGVRWSSHRVASMMVRMGLEMETGEWEASGRKEVLLPSQNAQPVVWPLTIHVRGCMAPP